MQGWNTQDNPIRGTPFSKTNLMGSSQYSFPRRAKVQPPGSWRRAWPGRIGKSGISRISIWVIEITSGRCKFHRTDGTLPPSGGQGGRKTSMNLIIGNGGVARKLYNVRSWMILPWLIINVQATIGPRGMEISQVSKTCMGRCFVVGWRCLYWIRPLAEISSGHHLGPSLVPRETEKRLVPSIYLSLCCVNCEKNSTPGCQGSNPCSKTLSPSPVWLPASREPDQRPSRFESAIP